jgi:ectoine hydroxylase-related dioxygenase (phytanoyl-CoA dioxygenase family)
MPELKRFIQDDMDRILAAIAAEGACIVEDLLPEPLCDALLADFDPHLDAMEPGVDELGYRDEFYGTKTKRLHGLFSKSPRMVDVLTHPFLIGLAERLFVDSGFARDVRLSNTELMVLHQDQQVQTFHTDGYSWRRAQTLVDGEILVSANIALTRFSVENGATRVVPGSHRWVAGREPEPHEICFAEMPQGAALIYSGNVLHSGGANRLESRRVGLYLGYIPSWLRPIENQLVTNDPADIMALPETAKRLLDVTASGFTVYA